MDEQKRTKILGGILAAVLCFMVLRPDRALVEPIREAKRSYNSAWDEFERAEVEHRKLLVARENLDRSRTASLPYSISDAQRLYQTWITNLAEQCRFSRLEVSPGRTEFRRNQYLTVNVDVVAETDLDGISRFLFLFEQADLMHRISSLEIESTGAQNNPRMEITLSAQGMSVAGSSNQSEIFARTRVSGELPVDATTLTVSSAKGFPAKVPFLAQLGREMIRVTEVDGTTWTVERGQENTEAVAHADDDNIQLFPVPPLKESASYSSYEDLVAASPFTKPQPPREFHPRIASVSDKTIAPGETVEMTAKAEDINADIGTPAFALQDAPEGMTIDSESGKLTWTPKKELPPEKYTGTVVMTQKNNDDLRVEKPFTITIQLPNDAPTLNVADKAIAVIGREFQLAATADDDGPADQLKFSFDGDVPEGLKVEESTGRITWTPAKTIKPSEYKVTVKVTDSGTPAASDSADVTLKVEDDHAVLTRFTGSVALDGVPTAYFRNLGTNDRPVLKIGDHVVVSEIDAELKEIAKRHVLLADAKGVWKLALGDNLRERRLIEPAEPEEPVSDTTTTADSESEEPTPEVLAEMPTDSATSAATAAENDTNDAQPTSTVSESQSVAAEED